MAKSTRKVKVITTTTAAAPTTSRASSRRMGKITKRQQRLIDFDNIITKNKTLFKAGSTISRADLVKLFSIPKIYNTGSYAKVHRSNLKLVAVQMDINWLMRANGLYLKSKNYYNEFHVCEKEPTKNTIVRYAGEAEIQESCEVQLDRGMVTRLSAGTWGTYNRVFNQNGSLKSGQAVGNYTGTREAKARNRVQHY